MNRGPTVFSSFLFASIALTFTSLAGAAAPGRCPSTVNETMAANVGYPTTGRLTLDHTQAACGTAKAFPGANASSMVRYELIPYENRTNANACVTVTLTATSGEFQTAAYLGPFTSTNPALDYLGDPGATASALTGSTQPTQSYSFNVPALTAFQVMVEETVHNVGGAYSLAVANCGDVLVNGISPALGPSKGGQSVTIGGTGLVPGTTVTVGGVPLTPINAADTTLTGVTGAHALGAVDVVVVDPDGTTRTLQGAYTYAATATSIVQLSESVAKTVVGESFTLTATVSGTSPTSAGFDGTVTFYSDGSPIGLATVAANGIANLTTIYNATGTHALTASFTGGTWFNPSTSASVTHQVGVAGTTLTLASSDNPSMPGDELPPTLTASLAVASPSTGTPTSPTGSVTFTEGSTTLAIVTLSPGGLAGFTAPVLSVGTHVITALYSGDAQFGPSGAQLTQVVDPGATSLSIGTSRYSAVYGTPITLTTTLTSSSSNVVPTGTVTFNGGGVVQTMGVNGGVAIWTAVLPAGTTSVEADYSGDGSNQAGSATLAGLTVSQATTTISITASPSPAHQNDEVVVVATVTPSVTGAAILVPGGNVTFTDQTTGVSIAAAVLAIGTSSAVVIPQGSTVYGPHAIVAVYAGDSNYAGSASLTLNEVVDAPVVPDAGSPPPITPDDAGAPFQFDAGDGDGYDASFWTPPSLTPPHETYLEPGSDACGCRVAGGSGSATLGAIGLAMALAALGARRRRS